MRQKTYLWLVPIALLVLVGAGCGKSAADKAVERAVEKATNGQADIDTSGNKVTVNVNGNTWQGGEQLSLPTDFPKDVFVTEGNIKLAFSTPGTGWTVSLESTKSVSEVKAIYEQRLPADGWVVSMNGVFGNAATLSSTKDNRTANVSAAPGDDGKTVVSISVIINASTNTNYSTPE